MISPQDHTLLSVLSSPRFFHLKLWILRWASTASTMPATGRVSGTLQALPPSSAWQRMARCTPWQNLCSTLEVWKATRMGRRNTYGRTSARAALMCVYIYIYTVYIYIYVYIYIIIIMIIINYINIRITQRNTILIISTKAKLAHSPLFCLSLRLPNSMQVEESDTHLLEILVLWAYGLWAFAASQVLQGRLAD